MSTPPSDRDIAALSGLPELPPIDLSVPLDPAAPELLEPDDNALDEIVTGCFERLRQVMDELQ